MKRLGSILGVPVYAQSTFLILIAIYALGGRGLSGLVAGLVSAGIVTVSILLHELGHAMAFRAFGERTPTIVLWGLGGLTYGRNPPHAWQSIVISLAGPAFGLGVGGVSIAARALLEGRAGPAALGILDQLVWINVAWTVFNLLPLHPLDGGQALRTLLCRVWGDPGLRASLAISIATAVGVGILAWRAGQVFAIVLSAMLLLRNVSELRGGPAPQPPVP